MCLMMLKRLVRAGLTEFGRGMKQACYALLVVGGTREIEAKKSLTGCAVVDIATGLTCARGQEDKTMYTAGSKVR